MKIQIGSLAAPPMERRSRRSYPDMRVFASLAIITVSLTVFMLPVEAGRVILGKQSVIATIDRALTVRAADLDSDGHMDVLAGSVGVNFWTQLTPSLTWYENDGKLQHPAFTAHTVRRPWHAEWMVSIVTADLDGDGDMDIITGAQEFVGGLVSWYENDGGYPPRFTEHYVRLSLGSFAVEEVFAADLNGDGHIDVLSAASDADEIAWYENDGGTPPSFTTRVITTSADGARSVFAADLDGDGRMDVLSASLFDNRITWYDNDGGSPPSFTARTITSSARRATCVIAADLDGDGDMDVVSASIDDDKIAWYENKGGSPPAFIEHVITVDPDGPSGPLNGFADAPRKVFAADVDGDGDLDILSASLGDDKIAWYENLGGSPPVFLPRTISTEADGADSVVAADVDGDGDLDVLSSSGVDGKIAWYKNIVALPTSRGGRP